MKSTGSLWMKQMLIQYLNKKFEHAAAQHDSDTLVEATDEGLANDQQSATGQPSHDPEDTANKIIQDACEQ